MGERAVRQAEAEQNSCLAAYIAFHLCATTIFLGCHELNVPQHSGRIVAQADLDSPGDSKGGHHENLSARECDAVGRVARGG